MNLPISNAAHKEEPNGHASISPPSPPMTNSGSGCCLVCGQPSHGCHFGVVACRACAAFFRRSIAENKVYRCRRSCQCTISGESRNMCRCCRFRKCEQLGMDRREVQFNRDPIGRRREARTRERSMANKGIYCDNADNGQMMPTVIPSPTAARVYQTAAAFIPPITINAAIALANGSTSSNVNPGSCLMPPLASPLLGRMLEGYNNFHASQKSLYTVMYPDSALSSTLTSTSTMGPQPQCCSTFGEGGPLSGYRVVTHSEFVRMERGCLSLMLAMLNHWFQPFGDLLKHEEKLRVLRSFSGRFTLLDQVFRTAQAFPQGSDAAEALGARQKTFHVLHYGQCLDMERLEYFFQDHTDPAASARLASNTMRCGRLAVNKARRLALRDLEVAALVGIQLWSDVVSVQASTSDGSNEVGDEEGGGATIGAVTERLLNQIYQELHQNILANYTLEVAGSRFGSLFSLLNDINVMVQEIGESRTISRIFNPNSLHVWDDI